MNRKKDRALSRLLAAHPKFPGYAMGMWIRNDAGEMRLITTSPVVHVAPLKPGIWCVAISEAGASGGMIIGEDWWFDLGRWENVGVLTGMLAKALDDRPSDEPYQEWELGFDGLWCVTVGSKQLPDGDGAGSGAALALLELWGPA